MGEAFFTTAGKEARRIHSMHWGSCHQLNLHMSRQVAFLILHFHLERLIPTRVAASAARYFKYYYRTNTK